ncbi:MAG: ABC transporter permease [Gemmatimonadota bacterium]
MNRIEVALVVYRGALRLLPAHFREQYDADLTTVVRGLLVEAAARGNARLLLSLLREILDVSVTALRVRFAGAPPAVTSGQNREHMMGFGLSLLQSARTLARQPSFTTAALLTLGIGIGCAAAAFGVWDTLLVQPLPHRAADQLVMVWRDLPRMELPRAPLSAPTLADVREQTRSAFVGMEAYTGGAPAILHDGATPERVNGSSVTGGLFRLLGNRPRFGRAIEPRDDVPGAERVVVLSHALWLRYFAGDPAVLDRMIEVREQPHRIVGVMGPEFVFPSSRAELWVPMRIEGPQRQARDLNFLTTIGRLRAGVTPAQAQAQLDLVFQRLAADYPESYEDASLRLEPRHEFVVGDARRIVRLGMGAAALLLLIACANLGNLMLVRGFSRSRELAVRTVLGATRLRVAGELLSEATLIGALGSVFGIAFAFAFTRLIVLLAPAALPRRAELGIDARVIGFAALVGLLSALVCSLGPALLAAKPARAGLATAGGSLSQGSHAVQAGFTIAQVSLAVVLLVVAGLLTSTLTRLLDVPVGFAGDRVLTAHLALPDTRYSSHDATAGFYARLFDRLRALPGVESVGGTYALPFSDDYASSNFIPAGRTDLEPVLVASMYVTGDYFAATGMRLTRGRDFDARDRTNGESVGIVNQTLARRFWPGQDPIGRRMVDPNDADDVLTIIAVVNDVRRRELAREVEPEVYLPHAQTTWGGGGMYVTVRTAGEPLKLAGALRAEVRALDPLLPVSRVARMDELVSRSVGPQRFRAALIAAISAAALLLTLLGIYSVQSVFVATRRRDLAVRLALGARPTRVIAEVVSNGLRLTILGIVFGAALGVVAARSVNTMLFGLPPLDPSTWLTTIGLFLTAATLACWLPAARVGRIDPMTTLRSE